MNRLVLAILFFSFTTPAFAEDPKEQFLAAARKGDVEKVNALLAKGVDVNAKTRYGATALWFAAYKGHLEVVKVLLQHKADINSRDTVWGETPLSLAVDDGQVE